MAIKATITKSGFEVIENFLKKAGPGMVRANARATARVAKEAAKYARSIIRNQDFEGAAIALTEAYVARKGSDKILIESGTYLRLISAHKVSDNAWTVGVLRGTRVGRTDYYALSLMLEFGTQFMPPRPMWGDVERWAKVRTPIIVGEEYGKEMGRILK